MKLWDSEKLWLKAKLFIDKAYELDYESADFAFYCALSLELLGRASLTNVHPALNADPRDDTNLLYGFGFERTANPRSLPAHSVYIRLEKVVERFGRHHRELCDFVSLLRNAHLHSADLPYENLSNRRWLPRFYDVLDVLNGSVNKTLEEFIGAEQLSTAVALVRSLNEEVLGNVKSKIAAHTKVWDLKAEEEKRALSRAAASIEGSFGWGEIAANCPSCGSPGKLSGEQVKEFPERYEDEELLMDVQFLSVAFKCNACGLLLRGAEEIAHAELRSHFVETTTTSLHDLYQPEHYFEYDNM